MPEARLPEEVVKSLAMLKDQLRSSAGDQLRALVAYGAVARGEYRPGRDEINLLVVLRDTSADTLRKLAGPLMAARRSAGVQPYLVGSEELSRLADVFPIKELDIKRYHEVIHGEDPLSDVVVKDEHLRLRVEQQLRNHLVRFRLDYLAAAGEPDDLEALLRRSAPVLRVELEALLLASGEEVERGDRAAIFARAARTHGLDGETLEALRRLEHEPAPDPEGLVARVLVLLELAVRRADELETGS